VTTVLLGATKPAQLEENFGALRVVAQLTDKHMEQIEGVLGNKPYSYQGWGGDGARGIDTI
jgi:aryl-alcohol dehydrogenase-like predicted oxidoreductase